MIKTSLDAAHALHFAYIHKSVLPNTVFPFIKENIRTTIPEHLSAMIYYSALLQYYENDI